MLKLVNSANVPTGVEMKLGSGFRSNGRLNGGLLNPDVALLGDLAIETATEDYIFRYSSNRISYLCYQFQTCIGPKCFNRVLNVVYC